MNDTAENVFAEYDVETIAWMGVDLEYPRISAEHAVIDAQRRTICGAPIPSLVEMLKHSPRQCGACLRVLRARHAEVSSVL